MPRGYAPPPYAPPAFQLADFIRLLDARRGLILRVALATILCALAVALVLPTTYSSSAVVMLDPRKNNVTDLSAVLSPLPATIRPRCRTRSRSSPRATWPPPWWTG